MYEGLRNVRVRYLNYYSSKNRLKITLAHPKDLLSVSLEKVTITNMNECVNLQNLSSENNTFTKYDIENMTKLKRIFSICDKYEDSDNCLLSDLR